MYGAQEDRQSLFVEADYDSRGEKLAWIFVMFGFAPVSTSQSKKYAVLSDYFVEYTPCDLTKQLLLMQRVESFHG